MQLYRTAALTPSWHSSAGHLRPQCKRATGSRCLPALQNVANIQCENCHGPGSTHVNSGGDPRLISKTFTAGTCVQCHGAATHHIKGKEWGNSAHAITTSDPAGNASCVGCHTNNGFIDRINGVGPADLSYDAISCQTCHEPHGQTTPSTSAHLVRTLAPVTLKDGTQVTNAGMGTLCMNCHQARQKAATYAASTVGSAHFGPHEGPQADMLMGAHGFTYGKDIPSSAHQYIVADTCVGCHTQAPASTDPALGQVGGHTFKMSFAGTATIPAEQMTGACQACHGPDCTAFNFPLMDYDGDGVIDGAQTEVQHLLDQLALMLPPVGQAKTTLTIDSTWTQPQLEAAYNWLFVNNDGSPWSSQHGLHCGPNQGLDRRSEVEERQPVAAPRLRPAPHSLPSVRLAAGRRHLLLCPSFRCLVPRCAKK